MSHLLPAALRRARARAAYCEERCGAVETWVDLNIGPPFVSFRMTFIVEADGAVLASDSTLRFRNQAEIGHSLRAAGFVVQAHETLPTDPAASLCSSPSERRKAQPIHGASSPPQRARRGSRVTFACRSRCRWSARL